MVKASFLEIVLPAQLLFHPGPLGRQNVEVQVAFLVWLDLKKNSTPSALSLVISASRSVLMSAIRARPRWFNCE